MSNFHTPVLLKEVIELLRIEPDNWYIDCNLGGGGHTEEILKNGGKVIGIDMDEDAIREVAKNHHIQLENVNYHTQGYSEKLILYQDNFVNLGNIMTEINKKISPNTNPIKVSGIMYDLGLSSYQLATAGRGFSFMHDAPLDMRMSDQLGVKAIDLIAALGEKELTTLFTKYGEEPFAKKIARTIVEQRKIQPIFTTKQLADLVLTVKYKRPGDKIHPATQIFQALRIAVNDELNSLRDSLPQAFELLETDGRLLVISFHSLEDRIVKDYFHTLENQKKGQSLSDKPIISSQEEISQNPRSRSAKMRVIQKLQIARST